MSSVTDSIEQFWQFVENHRDQLLQVDGPDDPFWDDLQGAIQSVHSGIYIEITPLKDGERELIFTADGNPELFDLADEIVGLAPVIPTMSCIALRPAVGSVFIFETDAVTLDPKTLLFAPMATEDDPAIFGVEVAIPYIAEWNESVLLWAVDVLLQNMMGERMAVQDVHHLQITPLLPEMDQSDYFPLPHLPHFIRHRKQQMAEKT